MTGTTTDEAQTILCSASGHDITPLNADRVAELAEKLTDEERRVLLQAGTEAPFCGGLLDNKEAGVYMCRLCELPLYRSGTKFDSGTGWPSFNDPIDPDHVTEHADHSLGSVRTEIRCARCSGHLGHVFDDGPPPSGRRHCLNSESMEFEPDDA
jgi:peptide-methionine (R)-S-oxide reductase